ncbi:MAG: MBL fold metallo-hydrolase, partial [Candidatus Uhrbacteria bacterium]
YHGDSCIRLTGKNGSVEFAVLIDPYDAKATGLKVLRPSSVDVVLSTTGVLPEFEAGPFCIVGPGEYEVRGVMIIGIVVGKTTVYRIETEGTVIVHLGNCSTPLPATIIEQLNGVDVLFVPVGGPAPRSLGEVGHGVLTAKQAMEAIEQVEPRVVIPIQYRISGAQLPYDGPEAFCKEMGCSTKLLEERFRVVKKDLPADEMVVKMLAVS